ncbi:ribosomal oxygenase 1-like isoform X2 [Watersipora subatra]|uniref:ribosomal oxygenase 1-like isoform X2 n=1 Tax=Watersipora subatra TaxID=2589382 RepID=UPI00355C415E
MVKSSGCQKVSAFAVAQAEVGVRKLDKSLTSQLVEDTKNLHSDARFNKQASDVSNNYERNLLTSKKRKLKKKKERKLASLLSKQPQALERHSPEPLPPLKWYGGPKAPKLVKPPSGKVAPDSVADHVEGSLSSQTQLAECESATPIRKKVAEHQERPEERSGNLRKRKRGKKPSQPSQEFGLISSTDQSLDSNGKLADVQSSGSSSKQKKKKKEMVKNSGEKTRSKKISVVQWTPPKPDTYSSESESLSEQTVEHDNPEQVAEELFAKLLHPHDVKTFMRKTWLKKPLHIKRKDCKYYEDDEWFSTAELDRILVEERVRFGVNIDLTTYKNGKRETHNPPGRAYPAIVWDHYRQGCSVRLLNPQTYSVATWRLLSTLQEMFGCMVGANVYLTPPGTQGFAPHYDDIEGFVLQLEGQKHWKVYGPRSDADIWPLTSSPNLTEDCLSEPIIDCVLEPGDLLYFPRGAIHQAMAQDEVHSLHMTVSTHQKNTWSDLLNLMLPAALANATENDPEFRESLPNDYLNYTGIAFQEQDGQPRQAFLSKLQKLMEKLMAFAPVDGACDLMAKKFVHDSLPPFLNPVEVSHSIADQGEKWLKGQVRDAVELEPDTRVRLMRKHSLRMINEPTVDDDSDDAPSLAEESDENDSSGNTIKVYYNTDNDRLYHGNELQHFEVDGDLAPAIEFLQLTFPEFTSIDELPLEDITLKMDVAMLLYDRGLLLTETLLPCIDSEFSEEESQSDEI